MADISVIMPVYNSQEYVEDAVRSVLVQDFVNFELLLVDDGSTDDSGRICDGLAQKDARVRVFHMPNGGMCHARNYALSQARGTYVAFCDNDDEYLPHLLSDNYAIAVRDNADCVRFGRLLQVIEDDRKTPQITYGGPKVVATYRGRQVFEHYDEVREGTGGVWAGLYRRDLLEQYGIAFDERLRRGFEDIIFNAQVFRVVQTVSLNPKEYYVWRRRVSHSSSFVLDDNYLLGLSEMLKHESALMIEEGIVESLPGYYGDHMLGALLTALGGTYYGKRMPYGQAKEIYRALRDVYGPYESRILDGPLQTSNKLLYTALVKERYWQVYAFVLAGGIAKRAHARRS